MAALCAGDQYGLSSKGSFNENKVLIFVKLTDSAQRAIEEYIRNENKINQNPTIQFLGNEGHLSFPSYTNNGSTSFNFSLSSTADMEGPGGSFECIQHMGPPRNDLEVLGPMSRKMRIHANDDIYEATRHRMAVVEENQKNKCTRVIKPNQTDIGRKVKVKQTGNRILPLPRREPPPAPPSVNVSKPITTSYQPSSLSSRPSLNNGITSKSLGSNCVTSSRPPAKPSTTSNIMKRPIKERLIHLLALQSYKKPELIQRLTKEGIKDQEKGCIITVLKQIATMRENTYILKRHCWNDVHDDWPFYTEQEKQMLKRRKPQNLTPPGSSDGGSSGSGQSPTSTHPGSPPPPISSSSNISSASNNKRPGYFDGADGLPTKKPRISHYRKPNIIENSNAQRRPITDSRDSSNMNPRSREPSSNNMNSSYIPSSNGPYADNLNTKRHFSDDEDETNRKRDSHSSLSFGMNNREKTFVNHKKDNSYVSSSPNNKTTSSSSSIDDQRNIISNKEYEITKSSSRSSSNRLLDIERDREREREREQARWSKVTSTTHNGSILPARVSPDSQTDPKEEPIIVREPEVEKELYPDYLTKYTKIRDVQQRRSYKTDFTKDYAEYRQLHATVEKVSRRFVELDERLKQENPSSPEYKEIQKQIIREYSESKEDTKYQMAKRRFHYLHDKLSHIKRLVAEYDERQSDAGGGGGGGY